MKRPFLFLLLAFFAASAQAQWTPQADSIFGPYVVVHSLDAVDENVAWAGASNYNYPPVPTLRPWVIHASDGGTHWTYDSIPNTAGYTFGSLVALDDQTCWATLIWGSDSTRNRLYRTTDGGQNWQLQLQDHNAGSIVHFFDDQHGVVFYRYHYRYTSDGGDTWSAENTIDLPDSSAYFPLSGSYTAVGDTLWITTPISQLARSIDRGETWELLPLPFLGDTLPLNAISFYDGLHGLGSVYYPPSLWTTADGGQSWTSVATLPSLLADANGTTEAVEAIPGQPGWYVIQCSDFNLNTAQTYLTKDYGSTWTLKAEEPNLVYAAFAVDFVSKEAGWTALQGFAAEAACVYKWDHALGLQGENPTGKTGKNPNHPSFPARHLPGHPVPDFIRRGQSDGY